MLKAGMFIFSVILVPLIPIILVVDFSWSYAVAAVPTWLIFANSLVLLVSGKWDDPEETGPLGKLLPQFMKRSDAWSADSANNPTRTGT
ncbi:MAG: hypothetical protein F4Y27_02645 [Acidimicrobiaceae bacterium]|nr:hypothetical protein [Acidimicrobiaceae bacterium]MXW61165.1 hypothetical protein [Acidimicrobiaceae bacterium]MXW77186.1 hypothetical protein [Acidimicrobiaceae bacterium]MYA73563.1 hypothetical protein [Acidimicrobiaceae bacterium]MYC41499.1 hypothetical protein [Acidimicrobiaceae bacterium]